MQLPDAIDAIRRSVVQIQLNAVRGPASPSTIGSGLVVGDATHVVTAKHVVDGVDFRAGETIGVAFAMPNIDMPGLMVRGSFVGTGAQLVDVSDDHDLALLSVPGAATLPTVIQLGGQAITAEPVAARLSTARLREGVEIAVSGYPLNEPSLVTTSGTVASSFSLQPQGAGSHERYLGDLTANPGNSGGPVYTVKDAMVIGVCVAGKLAPVVGGVGLHAAGLTVIVPAAEVKELLGRNGISTQPTQDRSKSNRQDGRRRAGRRR